MFEQRLMPSVTSPPSSPSIDRTADAPPDARRFQLRLPPVVAAFFLADLLLVGVYGLNSAMGRPSVELSRFISLNGEANLPAWYSSMQLCVVALMLFCFAATEGRLRGRLALVLWLAATVFLFLSLDEGAEIHEKLGTRVDRLLNTGHEGSGAFKHTGVWMFVCGPPLIAALMWIAWKARGYIACTPRVRLLYIVGAILFLGSATGTELLYNPAVDQNWIVAETIGEELGEMLGVTCLLWATWEMLAAHSFSLKFMSRSREDAARELQRQEKSS